MSTQVETPIRLLEHWIKRKPWKWPIVVPILFFYSVVFYSVFAVIAAGQSRLRYADAREKYTPDWASLDLRPLPLWYDNAKFGIFIHWGVFSVPSYGSEWFWWYWQGAKKKEYIQFMENNYRPQFTYPDFAAMFTAQFFDPVAWAKLLHASGARYLVVTSKHHEGYTMWPSNYSWNWNAGDVGAKRDLLGELADAVRKHTDLHFGLYHSLFEWFNPLYLTDKSHNFTTQTFVKTKTMPELYELVKLYRPDVIWSDGDAGPDTYWTSKQFLSWLYNESPVRETVVTNDRWGTGTACHHGGFYTCSDRYNPGHLLHHKWENCMTIDKNSWGYVRTSSYKDYLTIHDLIKTLAETVSCGGNLLMNVGPTHDGRIVPILEERLLQMGSWLKVNGEAIYGSSPWRHQNDTASKDVWYTTQGDGRLLTSRAVYAIVLQWPAKGILHLGAPQSTPETTVSMLGFGALPWKPHTKVGINVDLTKITVGNMPCDWAWVIKMTHVNDDNRFQKHVHDTM